MAQSRPSMVPLARMRPHAPVGASRHPDLPAPLTRFIGRGREIAEILRLLETERLLTLTGAGGCGKSRLALVVATQYAEAKPGGVCLVELAGLTDAALVPQAVAMALGIREEPQRPLLDTLVAALGEGAPLLLLDNCEHLSAAVAAFVAPLLRACPALQVLATSREPLAVPGEVTWRVPSLALPDDAALSSVVRLMTSEAAQLFLDRVRLRRPDFVLTEAHLLAITAICQRLDGMPLALELAAARTNVLSIFQLAARLDQALPLLTNGGRTVAPRHQTLRATLDWSYSLLTDAERVVLRRLAVFAGGGDLGAAEAVCGGDPIAPADVLALLSNLVDKSLVVVEERMGEARYRLLETVRQYAVERLRESGEWESTRERHSEHFLVFAQAAATPLEGGAQGAWLDRLGLDLDNIRAALRWLLESGQITKGLRINADLWRLWYARDHFGEGSRWLAAFLTAGRARGEHTHDPFAWMDALFAAARLAIFRGEYTDARALMGEMVRVARNHKSPQHVAMAQAMLGHTALEQGEYPRAHAHYEQGIRCAREANTPIWLAVLAGSLGITYAMQGDTPRAFARMEEAQTLLRQLGDTSQVARMLRWQGVTALVAGERERARVYLLEGIAINQQLQSHLGIAEALEVLAALHVQVAPPARALRLLGAAAQIRTAVGAPQPPYWRDWLHARIDPAVQVLPPAARAAAEAAGAAMTEAEAIAEGSVSIPPMIGEQRALTGPYGALSAREREVIALVAVGRLNREIAALLFITEKTVEWHIRNSLRKLGFRTRSELAVWATTHGLLPAAPPDADEPPILH